MSKTLMVAQREFMENMRTKTFWLGILAAPIGIVLFYVLMFALRDKTDVRSYVVLDHSKSETRGDAWLSKEVEKRARLDLLLDSIQGKIDEVYNRIVPRDLPMRQKTAAALGGKSIGTRIIELIRPALEKGSVLGMIPELMELQRKLSDARGERPPTEQEKEIEARLQAELQEVLPPLIMRINEDQSVHKAFKLVPFEPKGDDPEAELKEMLQQEKIFAYFVIAEDPLAANQGSRYVSQNVTDMKLREWFARHATEVVRDAHIQDLKKERGLRDADVAAIRRSFTFDERRVTETGADEKVKSSDKALKYAPIIFVYILWLSVFIAAQMLLTNTVEEKSNRIIEVLLSSVSPVQLMHGKIYGIALTGLTVVGSWALFLYGGVKLAPRVIPDSGAKIAELGLDQIVSDPLYLGSFLVYFLTGYLFYAAVLVAIGSVCNSLKEAQNLMQPVMFALFVPLATMFPIAMDPNGTLAQVITYIPLYTPFAMMNRAGGPPPTWEWIASSLLIVASLWIAFRGAAKVFRVGVLMTGKPPKIGEILRWMRAPVK